MNPSPSDLMHEATRMTRAGRLAEATEAIQRALAGHSTTSGSPHTPARPSGTGCGRKMSTGQTPAPSLVLDACVFELDDRAAPAPDAGSAFGTGDFTSGTHTYGSLTRRYKLYAPPGHAGQSLPLVVMLHGCTQDPDDFAVGTGMNERAQVQGFFVLYPAQAQDANPSLCWNWFKHKHQRRESGEAALLADMTRAVLARHGIDARRIYIAGLSAGGAMAAIVAGLFPELFAALGVHSGLPAGAASNMPEALAAMQSGSSAPGMATRTGRLRTARPLAPVALAALPTIVFHGDQDSTVHPRNGEQVIQGTLAGAAAGPESGHAGRARPVVEQGTSANGRRYTRTIHHGANGAPLAEHWLVHGAGHAWSGGLSAGSHTDAAGPDASAEMLRFFLEQADRRH